MTLPLITLLAWSASAQQSTRQDLEYRELNLPETEDRLDWDAGFQMEYFSYNNLDFRPIDESSDQAILDSDDRTTFAFSGVNLALNYKVEPNVRFVLAGSHRGMWGNDQIGGTNSFGGWVYFNAMYSEISAKPNGEGIRMRVGRQFYRMGHLGGARDYILADVLDMVRIDVPFGGGASMTLIPIDVMSTASVDDGANFARYIGQSSPETFNFRGDLMSRRHGLTLQHDELGPVEALAYAFYSDLGAAGTGSDITYDGLLGNFSDNDWIANFGLRADASFGPVTPFAHFDASTGVDRKELLVERVDTNGFAWGAGLRLDTTTEDAGGFVGELTYFDSLGPAYAKNGQLYSHGYVGMKAQQAGGTLFNRLLGYHPTAYAGLFGVTDTPQEKSRKSGTRVLHANAGYVFDFGLTATASWWMLQDTGVTYLAMNQLNDITPPFGYSRSEFAAEERLGRSLGQELNLDLGYQATDTFSMYVNGAYVLPGSFYEIEIQRVAGTALGAKDPASPWAAYAGTRVRF